MKFFEKRIFVNRYFQAKNSVDVNLEIVIYPKLISPEPFLKIAYLLTAI